jgi:quinohemoprotein amine dehydrogenase
MVKRTFATLALCVAAGVAAAPSPAAQAPATQAPTPTPPDPAVAAAEAGIPVTSDLVVTACGGCHKPDEQKRMSRISFIRAAPENWENTIKRMITLNGASLEPAEARAILKYLSDNHGLAPDEAQKVSFEAEKRLIDFTYEADRETAIVCSSCHSIGRAMSERRTKAEWDLLISMHRGYYPLVDNQPMNNGQGFRRTRPVTDGGDARHPMDRVAAHLAKAFPLRTPEWASWSAAKSSPMLAGRWAVSGYLVGKGTVAGQMTITADPSSPDMFVTETRYTFTRTGETITRKGRAVVYTGFQWRGRSSGASADEPWREVMFVDRPNRAMTGRWFTGAYDETGVDVTLTRLGADPVLLGTSVPSLKAGPGVTSLKVFGANFPPKLVPADVSLGQGIAVRRITAATPDAVSIDVEVQATAQPGPRDVSVRSMILPAALVVYDKVDALKVVPRAGLSRLGGANFPKQVQQFEAVAYHRGADGQPNTADDWSLGAIDGVNWSMEEYAATFNEDDVKFVGTLDKAGLFTPNVDGPNPERVGNRNNVGDVWVVADLPPTPALGTTKPIRARSQLVVAPPVYIRWFESTAPAPAAAPAGGTR